MSNETIADIAAEIRDIPGDMFDGTISMFEDEFHSYADRIEAAAKREECELLAQIAELRQKIDDGKFFTPKAARDAIAGERPLDEMLKAPLPIGNAAALREAVDYLCEKLAELDATFDPSEVDCLRAALAAPAAERKGEGK